MWTCLMRFRNYRPRPPRDREMMERDTAVAFDALAAIPKTFLRLSACRMPAFITAARASAAAAFARRFAWRSCRTLSASVSASAAAFATVGVAFGVLSGIVAGVDFQRLKNQTATVALATFRTAASCSSTWGSRMTSSLRTTFTSSRVAVASAST